MKMYCMSCGKPRDDSTAMASTVRCDCGGASWQGTGVATFVPGVATGGYIPTEVDRLRARERASHHITCNHRAEGIGGPGCICQVVNKHEQAKAEALAATKEA